MITLSKRRMNGWVAYLTAGIMMLTGCTKQTSEQTSENSDTPLSAMSALIHEPTEDSQNSPSGNEIQVKSELNLHSVELSDSDTDISWDDNTAVQIRFKGTSIVANSTEGVEITDNVMKITKGNTYVLTGNLTNGRIVIDLPEGSKEKVHLVMKNATISCKDTAPLTILNADKTILTMPADTDNYISDGQSYTEFFDEDRTEPNACIYSKDDLTLNGYGSLTLNGNYNNGIFCKNDLKLLASDINVRAINNAIRGDDSITVLGSTINIETTKGDGLRTENTEEGKGNISLESTCLNIFAAEDGIDSAANVEILSGEYYIQSGGGTDNAEEHQDDFPSKNGSRGGHDIASLSGEITSDISKKGIKAGNTISIQSGTLEIESAEDCIHSDGSATVGGNCEMLLRAGDDGIHAEDTLNIIEDSVINITECYEGLEAYCINIKGGTTHITAQDDGINAAGELDTNETAAPTGNDTPKKKPDFMNENSSGELNISYGYVYVDASGDGIDSNGDINITGGTVIVCGPTDNGNGPLDCGDHQNEIRVTGGTLLAVGSTGMMEAPQSNYIGTTQLNAAAGKLIVITDSDGIVLTAFKTPKQADGLIFSANGMNDGYHVYTGGDYVGTFNQDNWASGGNYTAGTEVASGSGGITGMGFGGGGNGRPNGNFDPSKKPNGEPFNGHTPPDFPDGFDPNKDFPANGHDGMNPPFDAPPTTKES